MNLRWDQCYGDGGAWNKSFACDTNAGFDRMVGSFELASDPTAQVSGLEVYMNFATAGTLPSWWSFMNAGTCRQGSLSFSGVQPAGTVNCPDWAEGQSAGGIGAYNIGGFGPATAYLRAAMAVPTSGLSWLQSGYEYFAFTLGVNHSKTVGLGSCGGCQTPAVVFLSAIKVTTTTSSSDILITRGANWVGSEYVSWQHGYPTDIKRGCTMTGGGLFCFQPYVDFTTVPYDATPARASTWGQVKALYR